MSQAKKKKGPATDLRDDVRQAIDRLWPDGLVQIGFDSDESYFWDVHLNLAAAFHRIKGARLVRELEPDGGPVWCDHSDPEEDPPDGEDRSRSYYLFFVCPDGEAFTYETEIESLGELDEEDEGEHEWLEETVTGTGRTGWSVAVSLLAPFAVVTLSDWEIYDDGSTSDPSIECPGFTPMGERIDLEAEFRNSKGEKAFATLLKLRARICGILDKHGIGVLPEEEWRKPVPGLRAEEEILIGIEGEPIRVLDAFFFEAL